MKVKKRYFKLFVEEFKRVAAGLGLSDWNVTFVHGPIGVPNWSARCSTSLTGMDATSTLIDRWEPEWGALTVGKIGDAAGQGR